MAHFIALHEAHNQAPIDINVDQVAAIRGAAAFSRLEYGDWHLDVAESLPEIRALISEAHEALSEQAS